MDIAVRVFIIAVFAYFTAGCVSTDQLPYTVQIEHRQKEMDRHPRLGSVLVFPTSGNIDPKGEVNQAIQREVFVQLGKIAYSADHLEKIFRDMTIPELFPLSIHSQISYFNQILKTSDIQKVVAQGKIRYPGIEFQYSKNIDLHLAVKKLALVERDLEPFTDAIRALDFETTHQLFQSFPAIRSDVNMIIYSAELSASPRYLMFSRIAGTEQSYMKGAPLVLSAILVNFETGGIRLAGRITSENYQENQLPYLSQVRNMTALLIRHADYQSRETKSTQKITE